VLDTYSGVYPGQMLRGSDGWLEEYPRLRNTLLRNP